MSLLFVLATAPACSGPDDPGDDSGNGGTQDTGVADTGEDTGGGDEDTGTTGQDTSSDEDTGSQTDGSGDGGPTVDPSSCEVQSDFNGQIGNSNVTNGGGTAASSTDVLPSDAKLQAVYDLIKQKKQNAGADVSLQDGVSLPENEQIDVSGAIVTATEGGKNRPFFYLQDQKRALYARLAMGHDSVDVKVGDAVSFTVTGVSIYSGEPQIQSISNFSVDSSGNKVPIQKITAKSDLSPGMYEQIVRIGGTLTNSSSCGGDYLCYDMLDQEGNKLITFRSNSLAKQMPPGYAAGTCITFVGPLGMFPGPLADDEGSLQIEETNWDWAQQPQQ